MSDPTWTPLIVTPNFPSYVSAHSTVSAASAEILTSLFGPDYAFTAGSDGLPGVVRSYTSFDAAAAEAGQSRIYGGIHYQFDNQFGLATGHAPGQFVFQNLLSPMSQEDDPGGHPHGDHHGDDSAVSVAALAAVGPWGDFAPGGDRPSGPQGRRVALPTPRLAPEASALAIAGRSHRPPLQGQDSPAATPVGEDQPIPLWSRHLGGRLIGS